MLNDYPDVLNVEQVAEILGIGINSAYRLVKERGIGSVRIGRNIRVPKSCVLDYLNAARYKVQNDNGR